MKEYVNMIPTSAITGEGMPDLIGMLRYISQKYFAKKFELKPDISATVLEVKVHDKVGQVIDVILVSGTLKVGDKIIIGGMYGAIKTTIKMMMMPHPMKEMRVKSEFTYHQEVTGSCGVKLFCLDLEFALAGSPLFVYHSDHEADTYSKEILKDFESVVNKYVNFESKEGIYIQASTLGSLEAILTFMNEQKVEISSVGLGPLQKKDVIKLQTILENSEDKFKENMVILAFDVKILPEAELYAKEKGIKIFGAEIIYHLFDSYVDYKKICFNERKKEFEKNAIFPCKLKILKNDIYRTSDPIILGVEILEGIVKVGTPVCIPNKGLVKY
jgi:translation initiation factor 5B